MRSILAQILENEPSKSLFNRLPRSRYLDCRLPQWPTEVFVGRLATVLSSGLDWTWSSKDAKG